jgi:hypothetical protein
LKQASLNLVVGYVIVSTCGFDSLDHTILLFSVVVDDESEFIICFKIKNPPTLHSSVFASVSKKWGYERKLLIAV